MSTERKRKSSKPEVLGFVGVGLDNEDEHQRVTHSEHFLLVGGSEETHERMQDTAIKFDEALTKRRKKLEEASIEEAIDLLYEAMDP